MKKIFKFALASVVVAFAGFGIYQNMPQENVLSDFALENIEALTQSESGNVQTIPCFEMSQIVVDYGGSTEFFVCSSDDTTKPCADGKYVRGYHKSADHEAKGKCSL